MPCLGPEAGRKFLENCPAGLEELVLGIKVKGDQPPELCSMTLPSDQGQGTIRRTLRHPQLKILSLPGAMNGYEEQVLAAGEGGFLQGCTGLEVIESPNDALLRNYWITDNNTIRAVLSGEGVTGTGVLAPLHGRILRRFCASMADTGLPQPTQEQQQSQLPLPQPIQQHTQAEVDPSVRDERLANSIWAIQAINQAAEHAATLSTDLGSPALVVRKEVWHTIVVHGAGPLVAQAIVHTSSHQDGMLVALDLIDPRGVSGQHIQQILVHSKYLRCLEIRHSDNPSASYGLDPFRTRLLATDIFASSSSWGCLLLTNLHLEIGGIPRSNESTTTDDSTFDEQESHRIQRQVYRRLSTLTRLQELRLGRACERQDIETYEAHQPYQETQNIIGSSSEKVPGFQRDCLEMTLKSGLDLLGTLKELSILDLSRMDHRVGDPELRWMRWHWPHLQTLRGV
ncbi:hypothetical protein EC957_004877 [Mortierella hygrophila]|uniref:Uncharacterized protein n=1 Tax=Mortierella hygrophila TaxID=979708 RepID=A0A9P6F1R7_9FUNG|nr:hypothetical protein EC957_004877 [Mortierella hygrophila]